MWKLKLFFYLQGTMHEPECNEKMQPTIGMPFDSWEAGLKFYTEYAHEVGFSVRTGTQHLGKSGEALWKRFVCAKQGWRKQKQIAQNLSRQRVKLVGPTVR